jgi:hypothetical protein
MTSITGFAKSSPTTMNSTGICRVICRRLPPTVTEEQFRSMECVRVLLETEVATLQFYSADLIGGTAAPSSATAILTIFEPNSVRWFCSAISQQRFAHPLQAAPVAPVVELAPLQQLPPLPPAHPPARPLAPIDDDAEFMQFAREYEVHHIPPTDQLVPPEEFANDGYEIDDTGVLNFLNDRMDSQETPRKRMRGGRRRRGG